MKKHDELMPNWIRYIVSLLSRAAAEPGAVPKIEAAQRAVRSAIGMRTSKRRTLQKTNSVVTGRFHVPDERQSSPRQANATSSGGLTRVTAKRALIRWANSRTAETPVGNRYSTRR